MHPIDIKIKILKKIYQTYHEFSHDWPVVCEKYCADCCTRNVTVTSLEAFFMLDHLRNSGPWHLLKQLPDLPRYHPLLTTNQMAALCAKGKTPPEELMDPSWGPCPFLKEKTCSIYPVRPFGCRCFLSSEKCKDTGHAVVDPFYMSVHTVVLQTIEHVDAGGGTGNLTDMMSWLSSPDHFEQYSQRGLPQPIAKILPNAPLTVLMVPDTDRQRLAPFLDALRRIRP